LKRDDDRALGLAQWLATERSGAARSRRGAPIRTSSATADETIGLATAEGLSAILELDHPDALLGRPGVSWTRLAFRRPETAR